MTTKTVNSQPKNKEAQTQPQPPPATQLMRKHNMNNTALVGIVSHQTKEKHRKPNKKTQKLSTKKQHLEIIRFNTNN